MKHSFKYLIIFFLILSAKNLFSQDVDIVPYLKQIENGEKSKVEEKLPDLKKDYPNSPSLMFLDGVLTENGQDAVAIYTKIVDNYPYSKYADAALYRIYSYYYALGLYDTAKKQLDKLKKNYPQSPYIKIAEKKIPSENEVSTKEQKPDEKKQIDYKYTIQAGAFSKLENAQSLKKDFQDSGFFSEVKEKVVGGTTFEVVYVGKFVSEDEAKNFLQVINSEFKLDGRVVNIE
jgi:tetratricopeptide (TPR) repeat protein